MAITGPIKIANTGTDGSGNIEVTTADAQIRGQGANAGAIANETASTTNPTLLPDRAATTTGIGGSGVVSLIVSGTEIASARSNGFFGIVQPLQRTLSSGSFALPAHGLPGIWYVRVEVESGSSDNHDTITNGVTGDIVILEQETVGQNITFRDNQGSPPFRLASSSDYTPGNAQSKLTLIKTAADWHEIARSTN